MITDLKPTMTIDELNALQQAADNVHVSDAVIEYIQRLVSYSRYDSKLGYGLSPRATLSMVQSAKAYALVKGRDHVVPEDVQTILEPVAQHRLQPASDITGHMGISVVKQMLENVDVIDAKMS